MASVAAIAVSVKLVQGKSVGTNFGLGSSSNSARRSDKMSSPAFKNQDTIKRSTRSGSVSSSHFAELKSLRKTLRPYSSDRVICDADT